VPRYVALLRGINVGGKNLIPMPALRACFETGGFPEARTYIQSGNVVFETPERGAAALTRRIEKMLSATFDYRARVVLRSRTQMRAIVDRAPKGFGTSATKYRYDVIFVKEPLRPQAALRSVLTREGVDEAAAGPGVLYFSRLTAQASRGQLSRIVASPIYSSITIRNWNTTTALLRLLDELPET
jgi:uncharacterized protein (DUF1697 family)